MSQIYNRAADTSASTGTGSIVLADTVPTGLYNGPVQSIHAAVTDQDTITVHVYGTDASGAASEVFEGVYTSSTKTLTRATVHTSIGAASPVHFTAITAVELVVPADHQLSSGATFPTNPRAGQTFTLTLTNRSIVYVYDGTNWGAVQSIGAMTMYVDKTGTDANPETGGDGTLTNAFLTIQTAVDTIPGTYTGNVIINLGAGTYSEDVTIRGKAASGDFTISIIGALTENISVKTITGGGGTEQDPSSSTKASVTLTTSITSSAAVGTLAVFSGGSELWVHANTTTLIEFATAFGHSYGTTTPGASETVTFYDMGTTVDKFLITDGQQGIVLRHLKVGKSANDKRIEVSKAASVALEAMEVFCGTSSETAAQVVRVSGRGTFTAPSLYVHGAKNLHVALISADVNMSGAWVEHDNSNDAPGSSLFRLTLGSTALLYGARFDYPDDTSDNLSGLQVQTNSHITFGFSAATGTWVKRNAGAGAGSSVGVALTAGGGTLFDSNSFNDIDEAVAASGSPNFTYADV